MGLFCGKTCRCKNRCKSWFVDPDLQDGCKAACKAGNFPASAEDYLDNIQSGDAESGSFQGIITLGGIMIVLLLLFYLYKKIK